MVGKVRIVDQPGNNILASTNFNNKDPGFLVSDIKYFSGSDFLDNYFQERRTFLQRKHHHVCFCNKLLVDNMDNSFGTYPWNLQIRFCAQPHPHISIFNNIKYFISYHKSISQENYFLVGDGRSTNTYLYNT